MFQLGAGLLNTVINKLPFEAHIPGYQYCGPGTRLQKRLKRGDPGINPLDQACKLHDIAYSKHKDLAGRHLADKQLKDNAWERVRASDAGLGEKAAALLVTGAMGAKTKLGMGCSRRRRGKKRGGSLPLIPLLNLVREIGQMLFKKKKQGSGLEALRVARRLVKKKGGKKKISVPRMIPLPKTGGFLPFLIPLFAGLSAVGALAEGGAGIAKAVNDAKAKQRFLEETQRHNKSMEALAIGQKGSGLFLKSNRKGYGLYLRQPKN